MVNLKIHSFPDFDQTAISIKQSVPSRTYLIELSDNQKLKDINIFILEKELLFSYQIDEIYYDIPTSDDNNLYRDIESSVAIDKIASEPVQIYDEIIIDNIRYARIIVFPISYENDGNCYFNHKIQFEL